MLQIKESYYLLIITSATAVTATDGNYFMVPTSTGNQGKP